MWMDSAKEDLTLSLCSPTHFSFIYIYLKDVHINMCVHVYVQAHMHIYMCVFMGKYVCGLYALIRVHFVCIMFLCIYLYRVCICVCIYAHMIMSMCR